MPANQKFQVWPSVSKYSRKALAGTYVIPVFLFGVAKIFTKACLLEVLSLCRKKSLGIFYLEAIVQQQAILWI